MRFSRICLTAVLPLALLTGCAVSESGSYQSTQVAPKALYCESVRRSFEYEGIERNPVVLIHGLLGAQLRDYGDGGKVVWGRFSFWDMFTGNSFKTLALPMRPGGDASNPVGGSVAPSGLLDRSVIELFWFRFYLDNYEQLVQLLRESGYVPEGEVLPEGKHFYSLFIFYYDWRQDIAANAARLSDFIDIRRRYLKSRYEQLYGIKDYDVRFDLIGHSMGGLVARYYAEYGAQPLGRANDPLPQLNWSGARNLSKVVIVSTPNAGYADTFLELLNGLQMLPMAPVYPAGVIGTFPSYYQMLPDPGTRSILWKSSGVPVDCFDVELWKKYRWGMLSDQSRELWAELMPELSPGVRERAVYNHLEQCLSLGRRFKEVMRRPAGTPPYGVRFYLFAGDGMLTNHHLVVDPGDGRVHVSGQEAGDGKVTATSARFDLRDGGRWSFQMQSPILWHGVCYLPGAHMGILDSDVFMDNLRYVLMVEP